MPIAGLKWRSGEIIATERLAVVHFTHGAAAEFTGRDRGLEALDP